MPLHRENRGGVCTGRSQNGTRGGRRDIRQGVVSEGAHGLT